MLVQRKYELNVRVLFTRGNFRNSVSIFFARKFSEKRVFLRAFEIRGGFWRRLFQIFSHKEASKTVIFEIEKSEEKIYADPPVQRTNPI